MPVPPFRVGCLVFLAPFAIHLGFASAAPAAASPKVLFLGIDGLRPTALGVAATPNLDALMRDGCWTMEALTDEHAISGAGWSNLLCGVWSGKHGAVDNEFKATRYDLYPHVFTRLAAARPELNCGHFCDWLPIDEKILGATRIADRFAVDYREDGDARTVAAACRALRERALDFVFVYFADLDEAGHAAGFHETVPAYVKQLERVDAQIGELLAATRARESYRDEDWLVLVTSDHGGTLDGQHGRDVPEHRMIPFIASGRAARRGRLVEVVNQVDVVPTALAHLGVAPDPAWQLDGHPVALRARDIEPLLGANLIANGGAEWNGGGDAAAQDCGFTAFDDRGAMTAIRYGAPDGFPGADSPGPKERGERFFCGGAAATSSIEQRIDVAALSDAIDAGAIGYRLAGWLGGFADQRDLIRLDAEFLAADGRTLGRATLGPVTLEDRAAKWGAVVVVAPAADTDDVRRAAREQQTLANRRLTGLLEREATGEVPHATRAIRIRLAAEAGTGSCDGYADELSLVLARHETSGDAAAVEAALARLLDADNRGDLDAILACYSADVVFMPPNSKPLAGSDLVRQRYAAILAASKLDLSARVDEIDVAGDVAVVRGVTLGSATANADGTVRPIADNFLMTLRRDGARWAITRLMWHAQESPP